MSDFKKASQDNKLNRLIDKHARIQAECYERVKAFLGHKPEGKEIALVNTQYIQVTQEHKGEKAKENGSITEKQKQFIEDLINKGKLPEKIKEDISDYSKKKASTLIERATKD